MSPVQTVSDVAGWTRFAVAASIPPPRPSPVNGGGRGATLAVAGRSASMDAAGFVGLVLAGVGPLLVFAKVIRVPATLVVAGAGAAVGALPGAPPLRLDPDLAIALFLPPIIYAGTVSIAPRLLRTNLLPGVAVGVLVSLATIAAVAALARALLPGLGGAQAVLLGVVAALYDTRVFQEAEGRPRVPRALADAMKAREIAARVVALTALTLALDALAAGTPRVTQAALDVAWSLLGGAAAGFAVGRAVLWLRDRARPAPLEIAVSIAAPYLAGLLAEWVSLSLVVTVSAAALAVSAARVDPETGKARSSAEARIAAGAFWEEANLLVSAVLFFFAGLALPEALAGLGDRPPALVAGVAAAVLAVVMAVQWVGSYASAQLRPLSRALAEAPTATRGAAAGVMAWASTRSVIGLVAALYVPVALPDGTPTPDRDLLLVLAALVILGSVVVQGLTLRAAVRRAGLTTRDDTQAEAAKAREAARRAVANEGAAAFTGDAERRALVALREREEIGDEALRKALHASDLRARVAEGSTGAGPPRP